jgi:hypothetical protein
MELLGQKYQVIGCLGVLVQNGKHRLKKALKAKE